MRSAQRLCQEEEGGEEENDPDAHDEEVDPEDEWPEEKEEEAWWPESDWPEADAWPEDNEAWPEKEEEAWWPESDWPEADAWPEDDEAWPEEAADELQAGGSECTIHACMHAWWSSAGQRSRQTERASAYYDALICLRAHSHGNSLARFRTCDACVHVRACG